MNHAQGSAGLGGSAGGRAPLLFVAAYLLVSGGLVVHSMFGLDADPEEPSTIRPHRTDGIFPRGMFDAVAQSGAPAAPGPVARDAARESSELYHRGLAAYANGRLAEAAEFWSTAAGLDVSNTRARRALERAQKELGVRQDGAAVIGALAGLANVPLR